VYVLVDALGWLPKASDKAALRLVADELRKRGRPCFLVINKIDLVRKSRLLPLIDAYRTLYEWHEIVPISAKTGLNLDRLLRVTLDALPEGHASYDEETITDQTMRTLAAELIREKILQRTHDEIPHSVAVDIDEFVEEGTLARITASILVEKESQKAIIIGKHGERLKEVGTDARHDMERLFGLKVYLQMWVKVREAWREDEQVLSELGY
jgi:GTP-binding protein Era